jgi:hypothetical protein
MAPPRTFCQAYLHTPRRNVDAQSRKINPSSMFTLSRSHPDAPRDHPTEDRPKPARTSLQPVLSRNISADIKLLIPSTQYIHKYCRKTIQNTKNILKYKKKNKKNILKLIKILKNILKLIKILKTLKNIAKYFFFHK